MVIMTYGSIAGIKERCKIDPSETKYDTELESMRGYASEWVDMRLGLVEASLPLSPIPDMINEIANDIAASYWYGNRLEASAMERSKSDSLHDRAMTNFDAFVLGTYNAVITDVGVYRPKAQYPYAVNRIQSNSI